MLFKKSLSVVLLAGILGVGLVQPFFFKSTAQAAQTNCAKIQATTEDQRFIDQMLQFHQEGIEMSNEALSSAHYSQLRVFAQHMKTKQKKDLNELRQLRQAWFGLSPAPSPRVTQKSVQAGLDFDRRWIESVIRHHQGTIEIARAALSQAIRPETKLMAKKILEDQLSDQKKLQAWLQKWFGKQNH